MIIRFGDFTQHIALKITHQATTLAQSPTILGNGEGLLGMSAATQGRVFILSHIHI